MRKESLEVLIVDDELDFAKLLEEMAQQLGHRTAIAANGLEAKNLLQSKHFDVLISDLVMPIMDGSELLLWLKESSLKPYTIIVSGFYNQSFVSHFKKLGVHQIIGKPCSLQVLEQAFADAKETVSTPFEPEEVIAPVDSFEKFELPQRDEQNVSPAIVGFMDELFSEIDGIAAVTVLDCVRGVACGNKVNDGTLNLENIGHSQKEIAGITGMLENLFPSHDDEYDDTVIIGTKFVHLYKKISTDILVYLIMKKAASNIGLARLSLNTIIQKTNLALQFS